LNVNVAYQHGFLYIRQLAIHLRKALTNRCQETGRSVSNWQFVSALQLWSKVIADQPQQLDQLHLPAVQVILGVFEFISASPRLSPLTFHMIRSAILLCGPDHPFVPLWPPIIEILSHVSVGKGHKPSSIVTEEEFKNRLPDLEMIVRLQSAHCKHKQLGQALLEQFYELSLTYSTALSHKIDFPELTLLPVKRLKEFNKKTKNIEHKKNNKKFNKINRGKRRIHQNKTTKY
jgi:nucleolar complex protein 2